MTRKCRGKKRIYVQLRLIKIKIFQVQSHKVQTLFSKIFHHFLGRQIEGKRKSNKNMNQFQLFIKVNQLEAYIPECYQLAVGHKRMLNLLLSHQTRNGALNEYKSINLPHHHSVKFTKSRSQQTYQYLQSVYTYYLYHNDFSDALISSKLKLHAFSCCNQYPLCCFF